MTSRSTLQSHRLLSHASHIRPIHILRSRRPFTSSTTRCQQQQHRKESFSSRAREALSRTRIQWYSIPAVAGIGFLGILQFYKIQRREQARLEEEGALEGGPGGEPPKKRKRTTPEGPWYAVSKRDCGCYVLICLTGRCGSCQRCH